MLTEQQKKRGVAMIKSAYTVLATVPGLPTVFYGDEVGLEGYKDPFNRRPYPWSDPNLELREFFTKIGKIRASHPAFRDADFYLIELNRDILIYERSKHGICYYTVLNNSDKNIRIRLKRSCEFLISETCGKEIILSVGNAEVIYSDNGSINIDVSFI